MMTIFDYLSHYTKQYIKDAEITSINDLSFIVNLNSIYRRIKLKHLDTDYKKEYYFSKIENILIDYLEQLNIQYRDYFILKTMDGTIVYDEGQFDKTAYFRYDEENKKHIIYIPLTGTLHDIYVIIHELFHSINFDVNKESMTRVVFTEFLSLLSELLLEDYLKMKKIKDSRINNNANLEYLQFISLEVDFNIKLIDSYLEYGYLNEKNIRQIFYRYTDSEMEYIKYVIEKIFNNQALTIDEEQIYIIGIFLATYTYYRIQSNPKNIQEFFEMNEVINNYSIEQFLSFLELDCENGDLTDESYKKLENAYCKYLKNRR